jgi:predicted transcriptional regulator
LYYFDEQGMSFKVTYTLRASRAKRWIHEVKEKFLDAAPIKCIRLDYEFAEAVKNIKQADLPLEQRQLPPFAALRHI